MQQNRCCAAVSCSLRVHLHFSKWLNNESTGNEVRVKLSTVTMELRCSGIILQGMEDCGSSVADAIIEVGRTVIHMFLKVCIRRQAETQ